MKTFIQGLLSTKTPRNQSYEMRGIEYYQTLTMGSSTRYSIPTNWHEANNRRNRFGHCTYRHYDGASYNSIQLMTSKEGLLLILKGEEVAGFYRKDPKSHQNILYICREASLEEIEELHK